MVLVLGAGLVGHQPCLSETDLSVWLRLLRFPADRRRPRTRALTLVGSNLPEVGFWPM
jgi:hypothetical protein